MSRQKKLTERLTGAPRVMHGAELVEGVVNRLADRVFDRGVNTVG
jgi:hypothetical protein